MPNGWVGLPRGPELFARRHLVKEREYLVQQCVSVGVCNRPAVRHSSLLRMRSFSMSTGLFVTCDPSGITSNVLTVSRASDPISTAFTLTRLPALLTIQW